MGINPRYIRAAEHIYKHVTSQTKLDTNLSELFVVKKGLRQVCCLISAVFKIYSLGANEPRDAKSKSMGILIEDNVLYTLLFADDQLNMHKTKTMSIICEESAMKNMATALCKQFLSVLKPLRARRGSRKNLYLEIKANISYSIPY